MTQRTITEGQRRALEAQTSPDVLLAFVKVTHPNLSEPLTLVADAMDYQRDGRLWVGILFRLTMPSDVDGPSEAAITIPNVDRRVGRALRSLTDRALVTLEVASSADFDLSKDPRIPLGTVTPLYPPVTYELVDVECTVAELTGRLMVKDYAQEPWPAIFATQDRVPGLFL